MVAHILAGLSGVYRAIRENGVKDIGLAAGRSTKVCQTLTIHSDTSQLPEKYDH